MVQLTGPGVRDRRVNNVGRGSHKRFEWGSDHLVFFGTPMNGNRVDYSRGLNS
jgi:hypothetical protein